ncbi:MAG: hypothetical protein EA403_08790 [Spirochaetaceae bacterium]|nr:MAG: hypothetical protein EA403_08790 [Spirochaetaceae bacterium]
MDEAILEKAKQRALAERVSLAKYIENAVREKLSEEVREVPPVYRPILTFSGEGVRSGIDLNDTKSLLEEMDGEE